jgi:hypothetical protein
MVGFSQKRTGAWCAARSGEAIQSAGFPARLSPQAIKLTLNVFSCWVPAAPPLVTNGLSTRLARRNDRARTKRRVTRAGLGLLLVLSTIGVPTGSVLANHDNSNPNAAVNCERVLVNQNAKGQTGFQTGSANDEKQTITAVTNCDHMWQEGGSNP